MNQEDEKAPLRSRDDLWQAFAAEIRQYTQNQAKRTGDFGLEAQELEHMIYIRMRDHLPEDGFLPFLYTVGESAINDFFRKAIKRGVHEVQNELQPVSQEERAGFVKKPKRASYHPFHESVSSKIRAGLSTLRENSYNPNALRGVHWGMVRDILIRGKSGLVRDFEQTLLGWFLHPSTQATLSSDFRLMVSRAILSNRIWIPVSEHILHNKGTVSSKLVQVLGVYLYLRAKKWYTLHSLGKGQRKKEVDRALNTLFAQDRLQLAGWPNFARCREAVERQVHTWLLEDRTARTLGSMEDLAYAIKTHVPGLEAIDLDRALCRLDKHDKQAARMLYELFFLGHSLHDVAEAHGLKVDAIKYKIETKQKLILRWMKLPIPSKQSVSQEDSGD